MRGKAVRGEMCTHKFIVGCQMDIVCIPVYPYNYQNKPNLVKNIVAFWDNYYPQTTLH